MKRETWIAFQGFDTRAKAREAAREMRAYRDPWRPNLRWEMRDITKSQRGWLANVYVITLGG